jgi:outer membrane receptor for ferrienterochelin and colicins
MGLLTVLIGLSAALQAQEPAGTVRLRVESEGTPLAGAEVGAGQSAMLTDDAGRATLRLPPGNHTIRVSLLGYARSSTRVRVVAGMDTVVVMALGAEAIKTEAIIVLSAFPLRYGGGTVEDRAGGTLSGRTTPAGTGYAESLDTRRLDGGFLGRILLGDDRMLSVRGSAMRQRHEHRFGGVAENDRHLTAFGEVALTGVDRGHTWVIGAALQHEGYDNTDVPRFDHSRTTPSIFLQDELSPAAWMTLAVSGRIDHHSEFGTVFNPRLSLLLRAGEEWNARLSIGTGYFAPTPFTEETEVIGLSPVRQLENLVVERARSASLDIGHHVGDVELNGTLFGSQVRDPLRLRRMDDGTVELFNAPEPTRTWGTDLLARFHEEPFHITATYTYTRSTELDVGSGARRVVPLTPRHAPGIVGMWEAEELARVGIELYYVGRQELEENPYRGSSRPYVVFGTLVERRFGGVRVFVNAENLLDTRQTRWDPLLLPARGSDGRWTTDAWAPLEGRTFNAGVRLHFLTQVPYPDGMAV